jgi:hypothetical protein
MIREPVRDPPREPHKGYEQRDDDQQLQRSDLAASNSDVQKRANTIESSHVAPSRDSYSAPCSSRAVSSLVNSSIVFERGVRLSSENLGRGRLRRCGNGWICGNGSIRRGRKRAYSMDMFPDRVVKGAYRTTVSAQSLGIGRPVAQRPAFLRQSVRHLPQTA